MCNTCWIHIVDRSMLLPFYSMLLRLASILFTACKFLVYILQSHLHVSYFYVLE